MLNGYRVPVGENEKVLEVDGGDVNICDATELYTSKWLRWIILLYIYIYITTIKVT